jgi:hypothetical protein
MYIETSFNTKGQKAWLVSEHFTPDQSTTGDFCVKFFYHMYGDNVIGPLNVLTKVGKNDPVIKWTRKGNKGNVWLNDEFTTKEISEFVVIFEGIHGGTQFTDLAIDDISVIPNKCEKDMTTEIPGLATLTYPYQPINCNFETDFCTWTNDTTGEFYWTRNKGPTLTDLTGPLTDVTTGTVQGHFIYIETSGRALNDTARLLSPPLTIRSNGYCFKFYYHMFGKSINTLNILLQNAYNQSSTLLWTRRFNQGNKWRYAQIFVNNTGNYKFVIEGICGASFTGDIAIDEISGNIGSCPSAKLCDFENEDICGFTNYPYAKFNWLRHKGNTSTPGTGPSYDHVLIIIRILLYLI